MSKLEAIVEKVSRIFPPTEMPKEVYPAPKPGATIQKHDVAIIWLHWFNALVWGIELLTGAALISSVKYQMAPEFLQNLIVNLFGTRANLLTFHIAVGIIWIVGLSPYAVFGFKRYVLGFLKNLMIDNDDIVWLYKKTESIMGRDVKMPPQGNYNAGQKMLGLLICVATVVIMISGLIMSFHLFSQSAVAWSIVLHFLAVGLVFCGLFVHVYMAAFMPGERPGFFSMFHGQVDAQFAYHHHYKWYQKCLSECHKKKFKQASNQSSEG